MHGRRELEGKVVFIAGLGPQMGAACALIAAREGAKVAMAARSMDLSGKLEERIRSDDGQAIALQCDLADPDSLRSAVDRTVEALGPVDGVFYNAGYYDNLHSEIEVDKETWQTTMDVNLNGPMELARLTIPSMVERGSGTFVFNSTAASLVGEQVRFGYQVSKAGLNALTRFIAGRYGRDGIRANAIFPFVAAGKVGEVAASLNCLGRSGTAEEIAEAVVFLLSDRSAIITGEIIHLDGGLFSRAHYPTNADAFVPPTPSMADS